MNRGRNIVFISHCILNQNTVVEPLARGKGPYYEIVEAIIKKGIGIHQLACPEFRYLGLSRKPMTKEEYDTYEFRKLCKSLSEDSLGVLGEYISKDYNILGLIGINHSPTCSIRGEKGIFMEEFMDLLSINKIDIPMMDIPTDYSDYENTGKFIEELNIFLDKGLAK